VSSLRDYDPAEAGLIYIDANIFIHVLLNDPRFGATCKAFLTRVEKGDAEACLSPLAIDEIAYKIIVEKLKAELGLVTTGEVLRQLKRDPDRLDSAKPELLAFLLVIQNYKGLRVVDVPASIGVSLFEKITDHRLLPRDALHLAIMEYHGITHIATSDKDFGRVAGIAVWEP
jgi:predicted nucleic acid-binding protein